MDAKFNKALSFSAHVITAVFTGSILYVYDRISTEQQLPNSHDMRLLCTALTLHDVNKYWNEITNSRNQGNYYNLIQDYFETDPFNIKAYFPEWESELDEIVFLVQHAEEKDVSQCESRFFQPKYARLLPYVKFGDKVASLGKSEYPLQDIQKLLNSSGYNVHILLLPEMPQQLLSQIVYRSAKQFLVQSNGIPLLISPQGILYLSSNKININASELKNLISKELVRNTNAKPTLNNKKFDLSPILSIPLDTQTRFKVYVGSVRERTEAGLLSVLGKTIYPPEEDVQEALACISYFIYNDKKGNDWTTFPKLEKELNDEKLRNELKKIGVIRDTFANQDDVGGQNCKSYTVHEIVNNQNNLKDTLRLLHDPLKKVILSKLEDESSALDSIIELLCAQNGEISTGLVEMSVPKGNEDTCFKCGAIAKKEYKPGKHFMQSGGFTKRATLNDQYKRECDVCQMEHLLIDNLIQKSGFRVTDDVIFFYFYFDSIFVNVDMFHEQMSKVQISVQGTKTEKLGLTFRLGDFETPFHIEPMAIKLPPGMREQSSKSTRRARAIHTAIKACLDCGCKCVITSPYTLMRMYNGVFYNERPTTLEKTMKLDNIENFRTARLIDHRLDFINQLDGMKGLHRVQSFEPITVIPFVKRSVENFEAWVNKNGDYLTTLFGDGSMDMKELAEKGVNLFGAHRFSGSYKRVKIFRTAMDSLVAFKAQNYPEEEAIRFAAAEVWKDVLREQYSPKKGKDIPAECLDFVESIAKYLKEHGLWNVKKISQWGNPLTDIYEFEYIQNIKNKGEKQ